jgi:hypothetical protein
VDETTCPRCGETDDLRGLRTLEAAPPDGGNGTPASIRVHCGACGLDFPRPLSRCRSCGGRDVATRRQLMTRHPRGTLLAVTGTREVRLCPRCDEAVIDPDRDTPVPEHYLSRFAHGAEEAAVLPADSVPETSAASRARRARRHPEPTRVVVTPPPVANSAQTPRAPQDPTVREAVAQLLLDPRDGEEQPSRALVMVLLGQELGPSTRMSALDRPEAAGRLRAWVTGLDGGPVPPEAAASALRSFADLCRDRGWVAQDLAAELR